MAIEENKPHSMHEAALPYTASPQVPALRNPRDPVSRMADVLELYLWSIVEKVHLKKIILETTEHIRQSFLQHFPASSSGTK